MSEPEVPFSLELADYFCLECGGLIRLPTGLILPRWAYRWCLCSWDEAQLFFRHAQEHFFRHAQEHFLPQEEGEEETTTTGKE